MAQLERKRVQWVDIAKGTAIFFVVWGHVYPASLQTGNVSEASRLLLSWWYVPAFFMLGGFFIKEKVLLSPVKFIKAKFSSIYRLLLNVYIPSILLHNVFLYIGWYDTVTDYEGKAMTWWSLSETFAELLKAIFFMGREPIMGAMWFVYVLFLALCGYSLISWLLKKLCRTARQYEWTRFGVILSGCVFSCALDNFFDINIPRFNISFIALWWIYVGHMLRSRLHIEFDSLLLCLASLTVYYLTSFPYGTERWIVFAQDMLHNTLSYVCALYVVCYVAHQIKRLPHLADALAYAGRESFHIMALHFAGFKVMALLLLLTGIPTSLSALTPETHGDHWLITLYLLSGVLLPLAFLTLFRRARSQCLRWWRKKSTD